MLGQTDANNVITRKKRENRLRQVVRLIVIQFSYFYV